MARITVLFLCTGNACRSQMAEGWARQLHGAWLDAQSAGTAPAGLDARAVRVMAEAGVEIAGQRSKSLPELAGRRFDLVVTVCDRAREACPVLPGARHLHAGFPDPPALAQGAASEAEALDHYRRVRDAIRAFVADLPAALAAAGITPGGR
jgi:arsenate reductase